MSRSKFLKHIKSLQEEELRSELELLYAKISGVKDHYKMDLGDEKDRIKIFSKAKLEISKKFLTRSYRKPRRPRVQKINVILKQLEKTSIFSHEMIDPYLYTCETALNFAKEYQFDSTPLSNLITRCFAKACILVDENFVQTDYKTRCANILSNAQADYSIRAIVQENYKQCFD